MAVLAFSYGGYGTDTLALLSAACWTIVLVGLGFGFFPRTTLGTSSWIVLGLMVALTAWTVIAISWANDAGIAYIRAIQIATTLGIGTLVIFVSKPGEGRSWIAGLTIGFGVIVVLAAASRFLPGIGTDAALTERLGPIIGGRLSWPLGYWNALGLTTAFFLVFCLWHGGHAITKRARTVATGFFPLAALVMYLCSSRGSIVASLIGAAIVIGLGPSRKRLAGSLAVGLAGSIPLILLAAQFDEVVHAGTGSAATIQGLVLLVATVASCAAVTWAREPMINRIDAANFHHPNAVRVGIGLGLVALILVIASNPVDRINSFTSVPVAGASNNGSTFATEHLLSESGNGRWQLWHTSLDAFAEQPVRGIGPGGFESYFKINGQFWMKTIDPHSIPLQFLSELGLIGFFLLLGVVGFALYAGIRRYRGLGVKINASKVPGGREEITAFIALLAIGMFGVSIDWTGDMPVIFAPIMVCIAALAGPLYAAPASARTKGSTALRLAAIGAAMIFSGAVIVASARQYEATRSIAASRDAFKAGDGEKAIKEAEQAISATPWAASAYSQLAAVQYRTGDNGAALAAAGEATRRASLNDSYWLQLSDIQKHSKLKVPAYVSSVTARSLNPNSAYWLPKP